MKGDGSKQSSEVKNGRAVLARLRTKCYNRDRKVTVVLSRKKKKTISIVFFSRNILGEGRHAPHIFADENPSSCYPTPSLQDVIHSYFP